MTDHLAFDQLCDLADGGLDAAGEETARIHVHACAECASQFASLSALEASTSRLPRDIAPPADLWNDIHRELIAHGPSTARRLTGWPPRRLAAAAVVIAVGSTRTSS